MSIAIHKFEDGYVFSEDSVWRPGFFESREAVEAAQHLTDEQIEKLQDAVAPNAITLASVCAVLNPHQDHVVAKDGSRFDIGASPLQSWTCFQDAAGTIPVTAVEQPVGLVR